ncbi:glycosyltransferase family 4 protein [Leptolyngbya sp. FACHB-16]|uniref:glycosyltransferase family 4 protein n=1 Tax=unclassified Leptolyngbya TaxID=2650499 RepID=UPI001687F6CF|nr:glycosyltransferase family 4 protein [Leptolyngbya sp. FACHB-16]MBD2156185.1 glycosyltransferase family 4 protein [Leptolyngbya sp. FACHB-16]
MKLLYYLPLSYGGIARYAHEQANALVGLGTEVYLLTTASYPIGPESNYKVLPYLQDLWSSQRSSNKITRGIQYIRVTLFNIQQLTQTIQKHPFQSILLGSYSEYLAPLWSGSLTRLAKEGKTFGAIVHDPVRDFVVGPYWWHRWSIACGYSFLREAFVHEVIALETVRPMPQLRTTVIPHGPYPFPSVPMSREELRRRFSLPVEAKVLLAFGHIRDNKNLDLVIQAIVNIPDIYLLVAGKEQSSQQKPAWYYQQLAEKCGVGDRIRWHLDFIPDIDVASFFTATDLVLLTYSESFRSASGVLNTAAVFRKPCLASSGESNLKSVVEQYKLGFWVQPDSVNAIQQGLQTWLRGSLEPCWDGYLMDYSWKTNAERVLKSML